MDRVPIGRPSTAVKPIVVADDLAAGIPGAKPGAAVELLKVAADPCFKHVTLAEQKLRELEAGRASVENENRVELSYINNINHPTCNGGFLNRQSLASVRHPLMSDNLHQTHRAAKASTLCMRKQHAPVTLIGTYLDSMRPM